MLAALALFPQSSICTHGNVPFVSNRIRELTSGRTLLFDDKGNRYLRKGVSSLRTSMTTSWLCR